MRLTWAGKIFAAGVAAKAAAIGFKHLADKVRENQNPVQLSVEQAYAAQQFAYAYGISLHEAVLRLYNVNLIG